eukprot:1531914-Prorocentrum_lima.AAC.1
MSKEVNIRCIPSQKFCQNPEATKETPSLSVGSTRPPNTSQLAGRGAHAVSSKHFAEDRPTRK